MSRRAAPVSRQIARRSKSNLAFALATLNRARKRDMITFYAYCRVIDDIADDPGWTVEERRAMLTEWKQGILHGFTDPDELQAELAQLPERYPISRTLLVELIEGVETDLEQTRYPTYESLLSYCYKVASVVGLVSIEIFGYHNPTSKAYAINLGYALQLTNIIRDVGEDAANGRIYLPQEDLVRFGVTEEEILRGDASPGFKRLMNFEYNRAVSFYRRAENFLPEEDRQHMLAAEMMAQIYGEVLEKIRRRDFRVFGSRIRLSNLRKLAILGAYTARGVLRAV